MEGTSKRLGNFSYQEDEVLTFEQGLCGFERFTRFVLRHPPSTAPISWLLSVTEGGPTLPVVRPDKLFPEYAITALPVADVTGALGCRIKSHARIYCVASLPRDLTRAAIDLRAPLIINPKTRMGMQYCKPGIRKLPIRQPFYRELSGRSEPAQGMLVVLRKQNETVHIGDDVVVEILETLPGGAVRLGIRAPADSRVTRGEGNLSVESENARAAASDFSSKELISLLRESKAGKDAARQAF